MNRVVASRGVTRRYYGRQVIPVIRPVMFHVERLVTLGASSPSKDPIDHHVFPVPKVYDQIHRKELVDSFGLLYGTWYTVQKKSGDLIIHPLHKTFRLFVQVLNGIDTILIVDEVAPAYRLLHVAKFLATLTLGVLAAILDHITYVVAHRETTKLEVLDNHPAKSALANARRAKYEHPKWPLRFLHYLADSRYSVAFDEEDSINYRRYYLKH